MSNPITRGVLLRRAAAAAATLVAWRGEPAVGAAPRPAIRVVPLVPLPSLRDVRSVRVAGAAIRGGLIGLRGAVPGDAEIRVRRPDGTWTRWIALPRVPHGRDRDRAASEPVWVGPATRLECRTRDGAFDRARVVEVRPSQASSTAPTSRATSALDAAAIAPRATWDDGSCSPRHPPTAGVVEIALIHHTASLSEYAADEVPLIIRSICLFHQQVNGWDDIGYNFLVDRHGGVYEGRAGGVDVAVIGAHAIGCNGVSTGIACIGTYEDEPLPDVAVAALAELVAWKLATHGRPVVGTVQITTADGFVDVHERVGGHRDCNATACPGSVLYAQLPDVRSRASASAPAGPFLTIEGILSGAAGQQVATFSGRLTDAAGMPTAAAVVDVLRLPVAEAPSVVAETVTDAGGFWQVAIPLAFGGDYRARSVIDGLESATTRLLLATRVAVSMQLKHRRGRHVLEVRGRVDPAVPGVQVVVERKVGPRWRAVLHQSVPAPNGRFVTTAPAGRPGRYRVAAHAEASAGTAASTPARASTVVPA